jgi:hypothetical protein
MDDIPDIPNIPTSEYHSELMRFLSESSDMRNTSKGALKQTAIAAGGVMVGSLVLGPVGGLVGGIVGSIAGFLHTDDYDGVLVSMTNLETDRRNRLLKEVFTVLSGAGITLESMPTAEAFGSTLRHYASQDHVRNGIWDACVSSLN